MPLQKANVALQLARGVDSKTDPKSVIPGKLLRLENGFFQNPGEIRKRYGYEALPRTTAAGQTITAGAGLTTYERDMLLLDGRETYGRSESANEWAGSKGKFYSVGVTRESIYKSRATQVTPDVSYHPTYNLTCYAYQNRDPTTGSGVQFLVTDATSGDIVRGPVVLSSGGAIYGRNPQVRRVGQYFVITVVVGAGQIAYVALDASDVGGAVTLTPTFITLTANTVGTNYDVVEQGGLLYVIYNNNAAGVSVRTLDSTLALSGVTTFATGDVEELLGAFTDGTNIWVGGGTAAGAGTTIRAFAFNALTLAVTAPVSFIGTTTAKGQRLTGTVTGTTASYIFDQTAPLSIDSLIWGNTLTLAGVVGTAKVLVRSVSLQTKAFLRNGQTYYVGCYNGPVQYAYFLFELAGLGTAGYVAQPLVAKILPEEAGALPGVSGTLASTLPSFVSPSSGTYLFPGSEIDYVTTPGVKVTGVGAEVVNFAKFVPALELATDLHLGGGFLAMYDGLQVVEHGYHVFPEGITLAQAAGSGQIASGAVKQYVAVYAWSDNQGQIHRSAPSVPVQITAAAPLTTVTATVPMLRLTQKTAVWIELYATLNGGTVFFLASSEAVLYLNDPSTDTIAIPDGLSDTVLQGNKQLYTNGGEVENIAAPAPLSLTAYKNRLVLVPSDSPRTWWYSKQVIPGAPAEFSDLFVNNIDSFGGDITGVAGMDDKLIFFKASTIFVVQGDGPTPNGANNDFSAPQLITSDCGCTTPASIVKTGDGIMFESNKGLMLLDRALNLSYIGADVEGFLTTPIVSAQLYPEFNQVRFLQESGVALVFDYYVKEWSTYTNHLGVAAAVYGGAYCWLGSDGFVHREDGFTDDGAQIRLLLQTSWLDFAQKLGFQRLYYGEILGEFKSAHTLTVEAAYDFDPAVAQTIIVLPTATLPYIYRFFLQRQKCTALQLTVYDTNSPAGEALRLTDISFLVGIKGGLNRVANARTFA